MRLRPSARTRRGITLIEVLAAIFIMGIGTLAILVLFPLGALSMARALKDDRVGALAINGEALCWAADLREDNAITGPLGNQPQLPVQWFDPANPSVPVPFDPPEALRSGYPLFVDPFVSVATTGIPCLGGASGTAPNLVYNTAIRRVSPSFITTVAGCERWFSLTDDLTFTSTGLPQVIGTDPTRQGLYTFAYMIQRERANDPTTARCYVVVYSGRSVNVPRAEPLIWHPTWGGSEPKLVTSPNNGDTQLAITWSGEAPPLRRGAWIYDTTYIRSTTTPQTGSVNGKFYRVVDLTVTGTTMTFQVEPPLQGIYSRLGNPPIFPQFAILEDAVEVFDRGTTR